MHAIAASRIFQLGFFLAAALLGVGLLWHALSRYSFEEIVAAVTAVRGWRLGLAAGFAAASYVCLTFFDYLALRWIERPLPYRQAALASFASLSLGHSIGFAGLSSGAIRYRFYSRWGLGAGDVAQIVLFCGVTVGLGLSMLAGISMMADPATAQSLLRLPEATLRTLGLAGILVPLAYLAWAMVPERFARRTFWRLRRPKAGLALAQIIVGTVNFALVAACLHQALTHVAEVSYPAVASAYVAANTATLITHVPGGLGVVETVVQHVLPGQDLIGPLLVFRFVYFLAPLLLGLALLGITEVVEKRKAR
ncbi:UPF0104 family protein [Aquabacter sp. L1I39]|nr:lysylphosphatidylglycerol synthase domain-containing protein [Aquabacter sp. L1I39]QTL06202.1 UPF0104 family protein [Aquabacter sp. L1I39]